MSKRGQVTIFLVVGILIIAVLAGYLYYRSQTVERILPGDVTGLDAVKVYVDGCVQKVTENGLDLIGSQGGYYKITEAGIPYAEFSSTFPYVNTSTENIEILQYDNLVPYYFYNRREYNPTENTVERELALYVEENLQRCTDRFLPFQEQGLLVEELTPQAEATISAEKVTIAVDYPISVANADRTQTRQFTQFSTAIGLPLGRIITVATVLAARQKELGNTLLLADLAQLGQLYDFSYDIDYIDRENVLYIFYFNQPDQSGNFTYAYAAQYDWEDTTFRDEYLESYTPEREVVS